MNIQNWQPTKNCRICSDHFTREHFYTTSPTVRLHANAVPTILDTAATHNKDQFIGSKKDNTSSQRALPVDVTQCGNLLEFAYNESQKAISVSTGTDSLSISCDYDDGTSTADDNIPQTSEIQQADESASDTIICSSSKKCYSDDDNSPIENNGQEFNTLPAHSTVKL